jgi:hypothetical protein
MVQTVDNRKTTEEQIRDEHNHASGSRKVMGGPIVIPWTEAGVRSLAPISKAISGTAVAVDIATDGLDFGKLYRVVSPSTGFYILEGAGTATTADFFVPAEAIVYLELNGEFNKDGRYSILGQGAGIIQFQEIEK